MDAFNNLTDTQKTEILETLFNQFKIGEVENELEVEKILDQRTTDKGQEFLVRWKGISELDTWEPSSNLENASELINEFYENKTEIDVESDAMDIDEFKESDSNEPNPILKSNESNAIITAPTQSGKTDYCIKFIKDCNKEKTPVIISSDKNDQQDQLYNRIKNSLAGTANIDIMLLRTDDTNFAKKFKNSIINEKQFIIFCLGNSAQISKIDDQFSCGKQDFVQKLQKIKKIMIIHDEGDVVQKDKFISQTHDLQAKSQIQWIELMQTFDNLKNVFVKRIFVTATPENALALYNITKAQIIKLNPSKEYSGFSKIQCTSFKCDSQILNLIKQQVARINNNLINNPVGEVILYCIERNTQKGESCHNNVVDVLANCPDLVNCVIGTYNGNGMVVYTNNELLKKLLSNITVETISKAGYIRQKNIKPLKNKCFKKFIALDKLITIRKFYSLCKEAGAKVVITIGKDLINRGISYVSECAENQLCATTLIYRSGPTMHAVGINQCVGRITGNARPDLQRYLFSSSKVISTYKSYNINQQSFLNHIENNNISIMSSDLWNNFKFPRYIEKIDRPNLELTIKVELKEIEEVYKDTLGKIYGIKISNLQKWFVGDSCNTLIGCMARYLYNHPEKMTVDEFRNGIGYCDNGEKTVNQFIHNIHNARAVKTQYGFLWKHEGNIIQFNNDVREYIVNNIL